MKLTISLGKVTVEERREVEKETLERIHTSSSTVEADDLKIELEFDVSETKEVNSAIREEMKLTFARNTIELEKSVKEIDSSKEELTNENFKRNKDRKNYNERRKPRPENIPAHNSLDDIAQELSSK